MSDPTGTPAAPATPAPGAPTVPPPVQAAQPAAPAPAPIATAPATPAAVPEPSDDADNRFPWLRGKLDKVREQTAQRTLKELGISDPEEAKRIFAEHAKEQEKQKSLAQKHAEAEAERKRLAEENAQYAVAMKAMAEREMGTLTPEQQKAVRDVAGDNHAAQVRTIAALTPTWKTAPPQVVVTAAPNGAPATAATITPAAPAVPAPATPAPVAAPLNTAPPAIGTPPPATQQEQTNYLAIYEGLLKTNPIRAANYKDMNWAAIDAAQKARAG